MNENDNDLRNQREVIKDVENWLQSLPAVGGNGEGFSTREIRTVEHESSPDYQLWWNHLCVGVIEVKCFTKEHPSWLIDRPKMEMLYKNYQAKGIPAMLCFAHIVDGLPCLVELADLRDLIANKDRWEDAPESMMKTTGHGKGERKNPFPGFLLPRDLFWRVT